MKIVDRYILGELIRPAFFGLCIFSSLWLVNVLMKMIDLFVTKEVPLVVVGKIFAYNLPLVFTTACPMAMLLAALMAMGRLNADSEFTALRSCGVSLYRIMRPILGMGLVTSVFVLLVSEYVVPQAGLRRNRIYLNEVLLKKPLPKVASNIFFEGGKEFKMFVRHYSAKENRVRDVTVFHFEPDGFPRITEAQSAILSEREWRFFDGTMYTTRPAGTPDHLIHFGSWTYPLDLTLGSPVNEDYLRPSERPLPELYKFIHEQEEKGLPTTGYWVDFFWKTSFPFASFFLMLMGAPLACGSSRSGASLGVGLSVILMFAYYVLLALARGFGEAGRLPPLLAAWFPNLVVFLLGIWLVRRAAV